MEPVIKLTRIKTYNCCECTTVFLSGEKLEKHSKLHAKKLIAYDSESEKIKCKALEFCFPTSRECALHERYPCGPREINGNATMKVFKCEHCFVRFDTQSILETHLLLHQPLSYKCHCGIDYHTLSDLQTHINLAHLIKQESDLSPNTSYTKHSINPENSLVKIGDKSELKVSPSGTKRKNNKPIAAAKSKPKTSKKDCIKPTFCKSFKNEGSDDVSPSKSPKMEAKRQENKITTTAKPKTTSEQDSKYDPNLYMSLKRNGTVACSKCNINLSSKSTYKLHYHRRHSRKYICPQCDKGFGFEHLLKRHMVVHLDKKDRPYSCSTCGKRFTQTASLNVHYKAMHLLIKDQICRYCKKAFSERGALQLHERTHTGYKHYKCNYCDKGFGDPSAFKRHIRTHTGEKRYACPECPMKFTDASGLRVHKLRHKGVKKFKCGFCYKAFYIISQLKKHVEIVHEGIKKFECYFCGKKTSSKNNLQTHVQSVHKKELGQVSNKFEYSLEKITFKCTQCEEKFSYKHNLNKHIKKMHKIAIYCNICEAEYFTPKGLENHKARCSKRKVSKKL